MILSLTHRKLFLSTLSARRATRGWTLNINGPMNFYPRSPQGERRPQVLRLIIGYIFLSTLSARRATHTWKKVNPNPKIFLSTLSARRATKSSIEEVSKYVVISIHALRKESDTPITFRHCTTYLFLSTLSARRATVITSRLVILTLYFYPRSPQGERPLII